MWGTYSAQPVPVPVPVPVTVSAPEHTASGSLWVTFNGWIVDVSSFVAVHPGGQAVIQIYAGKDITSAFIEHGHSEKAYKILDRMKIGRVERKNCPEHLKTTVADEEYPGDSITTLTASNFPFPVFPQLRMTMNLLPEKEWILCDQNFEMYLTEKHKFLAEVHDEVFQVSSDFDTKLGGVEVLELLGLHLPKRYPSLYEKIGDVLRIKPLGYSIDTKRSHLHPLDLAVPEDLVIMKQDKDGDWVLAAASLAFPSAWTLSQKINRKLQIVHDPVPTLNEHIGASITKYFTQMKPSTTYPPAITRYNWNIEYNSDLRLLPCTEKVLAVFNLLSASVERQTLRKLPKSGDILFTIGILQIPLRELAADPQKRNILLHHFKDDNLPEFRSYHRKYRTRQVIINYLEKLETEDKAPKANL